MNIPETPLELRHFVGCKTLDGELECKAARWRTNLNMTDYPIEWLDQEKCWNPCNLDGESDECVDMNLILPADAPILKLPPTEAELLRQRIKELEELLSDIRNHQNGNRYNYREISELIDEAIGKEVEE